MDETTLNDIEKLKVISKGLAEKLDTAVRNAPTQVEISNLRQSVGDMIDDQAKRLSENIENLERAQRKLSDRQDALEDSDTKQSEGITELQAADRQIHIDMEKGSRQLEEIQARLDGTRIPQIKESSLEAMRSVLTQTADLLAGSGGQLPYREIQAKLQNTLFLGQVLKVLASLFGVGGVLAAGSALLGVGKAPDFGPDIANNAVKIEILTAENKNLAESLSKLEDRINELTKPSP